LNAWREHGLRHQSLLDGVVRANISNSTYLRLCAFAVNPPSSAGLGVHRSNSQPRPPAPALLSRRDDVRSSASIGSLNYLPPAGHGVHRSIRDSAPLHRRPT
jgi:hypothetical protein